MTSSNYQFLLTKKEKSGFRRNSMNRQVRWELFHNKLENRVKSLIDDFEFMRDSNDPQLFSWLSEITIKRDLLYPLNIVINQITERYTSLPTFYLRRTSEGKKIRFEMQDLKLVKNDLVFARMNQNPYVSSDGAKVFDYFIKRFKKGSNLSRTEWGFLLNYFTKQFNSKNKNWFNLPLDMTKKYEWSEIVALLK